MIGVVNRVSGPRDVVVCAAGSMPGDLHKLWRTRDPKGYHVEYGFSCMGYEIAGGLGVKLAAPDREVYVMVGDGSFLMMAQEIVTAVQEDDQAHDRARPEPRLRVDRRALGVASGRSASAPATAARRRGAPGRPRGGRRGPRRRASHRATTIDELEAALREAAASSRITVVEIQTDPLVGAPDSEAWWDVPVAEVAGLDSTRAARETYEQNKRTPAAVPDMSVGVGVIGAGMMGAAHVATLTTAWRARTSPPSPTPIRARAEAAAARRAARGRSPIRSR